MTIFYLSFVIYVQFLTLYLSALGGINAQLKYSDCEWDEVFEITNKLSAAALVVARKKIAFLSAETLLILRGWRSLEEEKAFCFVEYVGRSLPQLLTFPFLDGEQWFSVRADCF